MRVPTARSAALTVWCWSVVGRHRRAASSLRLSAPTRAVSRFGVGQRSTPRPPHAKQHAGGRMPRTTILCARPRSSQRRDDGVGLAKGVERPSTSNGPHQHRPKPRPSYGWFPLPEGDDDDDQGSNAAISGLPRRGQPYAVLGIETSCDDTAAAVVRSDGVILGESRRSQHALHAEFGGVVPWLAKEAHERAIDAVVDEALQSAGLASVAEVDAIAATVGPGLEICLRVGATKAAALARHYAKPFSRVHHLEAHCLVARLPDDEDRSRKHLLRTPSLEFPFVALLASGGHCQLLVCSGLGRFELLGGTLDDALGEAFDKAARALRLDPRAAGGGPALERAALAGNPEAVELPIPMRRRRDCDLSYAGLKNALRVQLDAARLEAGLAPSADDDPRPLDADVTADFAASFQRVAIAHLADRVKNAFDVLEKRQRVDDDETTVQEQQHHPRTLALVGGVAANQKLRETLAELCERRGWRFVVPPPALCTDNGVMVAWAAIEKFDRGLSDDADDVEVYARWPFRIRPSSSSSSGDDDDETSVGVSGGLPTTSATTTTRSPPQKDTVQI